MRDSEPLRQELRVHAVRICLRVAPPRASITLVCILRALMPRRVVDMVQEHVNRQRLGLAVHCVLWKWTSGGDVFTALRVQEVRAGEGDHTLYRVPDGSERERRMRRKDLRPSALVVVLMVVYVPCHREVYWTGMASIEEVFSRKRGTLHTEQSGTNMDTHVA